jgi:hypothetical protein
MRFMVIMYPGADAEAGKLPDEKMLAEMGKFNEELVQAGVMLDGAGLHPSSRGSRVTFAGGKPTVSHGPFADVTHIIGGFWMWQCGSKDEALAWIKRCPAAEDNVIELRQVMQAEDFGAAFTPELQEQEQRLREAIGRQ